MNTVACATRVFRVFRVVFELVSPLNLIFLSSFLGFHERVVDVELRVGIDDRSGSMGAKPYLGYDMRAMRGRENNENNKHHGDEHERQMNDSKGGWREVLDFR